MPRTVRDRGALSLRAAPPLRAIGSLAVDRDGAEEIPRAAAALPPALPVAPTATPQVAAAAATPDAAMALRGEYWEIRYQQHSGVVPDCRGLRYIALLMRDAGGGRDPIHAKELTALANGQQAGAIEVEIEDTVLDTKATKQLLKRLEDLAFERDRAAAVEDFTRAAQLDDEYEQIAAEIGRGSAPRGTRRRKTTFVHAGEKARKAVAKAIAEAIGRIAAHPDLSLLAEHLTLAIRKGRWLSYTGSVDWHIEFRAPLPRK